ncbi:hypothetical protein [Kribbia dieselivorans]|uniref:hypothetical protein n=1 Tax=Kribbia dieselivorans TaxID=331526 RepID=UPI0008392473|nr:hypothetical protein [Kribbia dieselivorans]
MTQVAPANEIELYFQSLQQGSVLHRSVENAHAFAALGNDSSEAAVVSQTCDVVLPKRPTALLAPVVELHGEELRIARRRDNPRFVHLPRRGAAFFADLGHIHAIHKTALVGSEVTDGIDLTDDAEIRTLALAIGRWFSRFAFPDEVVPWLRPLLKVIREKYNKSQSPVGQVLQDVVEIRVEAQSWAELPLDLVLHVIVRAGAVPTMDDSELGQVPPAAFDAAGEVVGPTDLAALLTKASDPASKAALWPLLAESMARLCRPSTRDPADPSVESAVSGIVGEFWADDEFPLSRYRKSELLDVDYLSAGYPL